MEVIGERRRNIKKRWGAGILSVFETQGSFMSNELSGGEQQRIAVRVLLWTI